MAIPNYGVIPYRSVFIGFLACANMLIYDTLSGTKREFREIHKGRVGMYVCGPTTYDYAHIGHARVAIVFDVFRRFLEYLGYDVVYVSNITDIDDKIISKARELGKDPIEMAHYYANEYLRDMAKLRVRPPNIIPKATRHIDEIIELIQKLINRGFAYVSEGDVYFSVEKYREYGKLSHRKLEEMIAGVRVDVSDKKKNPLDFALWKAAKPGEPSWSSPWGEGRPGWHIECSAMSMRYIGETLDIHGGGADLIFPHHENEIAQSECATGKPFVNYWMHVGLVRFNAEKMSKSVGNVFLVRELVKIYPPEAIRLMFLNAHYRKPYDFTEKNLEDSKLLLQKIWDVYYELKRNAGENGDAEECEICSEYEKKIISALSDDFNTREAIKHYLEFISIARKFTGEKAKSALTFLEKMDSLFDILPEQSSKGLEEELVELIIEIRTRMRKEKKYDVADWIRDKLSELGIKIEDSREGTRWMWIK